MHIRELSRHRHVNIVGLFVAPGLAAIIATAAIVAVTGRSAGFFTRDPSVLGDLPYYAGALSTFTVGAWMSAASLAAVAGWIVPARRAAMLHLAALLAILGVDDGLMVHEALAPRLGIPETVLYAVYALLALATVRAFAPRTGGAATWVLLLGFALLGSSVASDVVAADPYLLEDGLKLLGVLTLASVPVLTIDASRSEAAASVTPTSRQSLVSSPR